MEPPETFGLPPHRPWYRYRERSAGVLAARLRNRWQPAFRLRMAWQRARRGYGDDQLWNLNDTLARLTVEGVKALREQGHGYPAEFADLPVGDGGGWEKWDGILARIEAGFQAWLDNDGWFANEEAEAEAKFKDAMSLYVEWFGALWD